MRLDSDEELDGVLSVAVQGLVRSVDGENPPAGLNDDILRQLRVSQPALTMTQPVSIPCSTKRTVLMRVFFPSATAALVVLGVVSLFLWNGTPSTALADVVKAVEKHKLVRVTKTQITEDKDHPSRETQSTEYWDLSAPRARSEMSLSENSLLLEIEDHVKGRVLKTNSKQKTGTLLIVNPTTMSNLDKVKEFQTRKETTSAQETLNGSEVVRYHVQDQGLTATLWVDPTTNLPVRMEYEVVNPRGKLTRKWTYAKFEWDPQLKDIQDLNELFSTEPPGDYAIQKLEETAKDAKSYGFENK